MLRTKLLTVMLAGSFALGSTGCIKKMMVNGQISATREGSGAADTIGDYELARSAASAGMLQFEGMHRLAPDNEDALYLLTKGWTGYGYAFPQDDYEAAKLAGDETQADYHKGRTKLAFDRGVSYGIELLGHKAKGFDDAKKNADTMRAWLNKEFTDKEDAEPLFWAGSAWLARVNLMKDDDELGPKYIGELFVGVSMLERSRELDPAYMNYGATSTLGAYFASMKQLDQSKKLLDEALEKTQHKSLGVQANYAKLACASGDRATYEKMLNEVLNAEDPDPNQRLPNTIAKRRAKRGLTKAAMEECGFGASTPAAPASAQPPAAAPAPHAPPK